MFFSLHSIKSGIKSINKQCIVKNIFHRCEKTITINKVDIKLCETDGSGAVSYLRLSNL